MKSTFFILPHKIVLVILHLLIGVSSFGQGLQDSLRTDDDDIVSSIAAYPADVREAILNVSRYPQLLVKIERIQARTSQGFQDMLAAYPRGTQEKFYDLSRYPDLVDQLARHAESKSTEPLNSLLSSYPDELQESVNELYELHQHVIEEMNESNQQANGALTDIIKTLPKQTQEDFGRVIGLPDIMMLLTDLIDLTVSLGEAFTTNPEAVRQHLDLLHEQISAQTVQDLEEYKKEVTGDPKLQEEMRQSSIDFAINYADTDDGAPTATNSYYNGSPYPYWNGYPYWYPSPSWYPRPLYYHTGFYLNAAGGMVVVGLPSYAYSNWFFNYGYSGYPRMYGRYHTYYNNHRNSRTNINVYRGYNSAVHDHFSRVNGSRPNNSPIRPAQQRTGKQGTVANSSGRPSTTNGNRSRTFQNSIHYNGNSFNNQPYSNFHSQQFHQQRWGGVGGAGMQRGNGMQRSGGTSGGSRSGGGRRGH